MSLPFNPPVISVIIPVYNGGENFRKCLASLDQSLPGPDEMIVVADGEGNGSWRIAEEFNVQVLRIAGPKGPAHARNKGAQIAHGEILFFVDADVAVYPDTIGKVIEVFKKEPDLAGVFGSYDGNPSATNFLSLFKNLFHHYIHQTSFEEASTFWGACGAIRRDIFLTLGGFNERYRRPSVEDIELGYRLKREGHRIKLSKTIQVKHLKRWNFFSLLRSDIFDRALPWTDLILREHRLINDLNLRTSSRISILLIYGLLGSLVGVKWWLGFIPIAGILAFMLLVMNGSLYRFFEQKCGLMFAIRAIPTHWFYFFYCGFGFMLGVAWFTIQRMSRLGARDASR